MDFRKDATIRPNRFTTAQPLYLPRPSHLFFIAIFVFAIFVLISLGENQLCFRVFVYAMTFITSPFFHINHLDLGAFVEVQFTGHSTMLKMFDIIFSDFQKVYYQPMGKKCWGNTWKNMLCKIAWATRANYRGQAGEWINNLGNQARPVAETQEWWGGSFIGDPTFFNWDLLVLSWSSYSYFDQFIISLRTHICSVEEFRV